MPSLDLNQILSLDRLKSPYLPSRAGWLIDQDATLQSMDRLGIVHPIQIKYMTGKWRNGTHYSHHNKGYHRILLDQNRMIAGTNFTLWHELVHARQSENYATVKEWDEAYHVHAKGRHGKSYQENLFELEANRIAAQNEHICLLTFAP